MTIAERAVFSDPSIPASGVTRPHAIAAKLAEETGCVRLDSKNLGAWLENRVFKGASRSVLAMVQGVVPASAADRPHPDCLLSRYMRAGGVVVWVGEDPFHFQGRRGRLVNWDIDGTQEALGLDAHWDRSGTVKVTEAGRVWGLAGDVSARCVPKHQVTEALSLCGSRWACSWRLRLAPKRGGLVRLRGGRFSMEHFEELQRAFVHAAGTRAVSPEDGVLVSEGSFKVDRRRAVEVLSRFQLPEPELLLLPLARAAVAAGSTALDFKVSPRGLSAGFDGRPFSAAEAEDPYGALLGERRARDPRLTGLALFLLAAEGLKAKAAVSGGEIQLSGRPAKFWRAALAALEAALFPGRLKLSVDGSSAELPAPSTSFEDKGRRVWLAPAYDVTRSSLSPCVLGVAAGTEEARLPLPVRAFVEDDAFKLNATQSAVVRDRRYKSALSLPWHGLAALAKAAVEEQRRLLPEVSRVVSGTGWGPTWGRLLDSADASLAGLVGRAYARWRLPEAEERLFERVAALTRWLREAVDAADLGAGAREALKTAPLFVGSRGTVWTLAEARRACSGGRTGVLVDAETPEAGLTEGAILVCGGRDRRDLDAWL